MGAKGTKLLTTNRESILNLSHFRALRKRHLAGTASEDISYKEFADLVKRSNERIAEAVQDSKLGFKLPHNMGYLSVVQYKSAKPKVDHYNTKKFNKLIHYTNLHSFGLDVCIRWFSKDIARFKFADGYKFFPVRTLKRSLATRVKNGEEYSNLDASFYKDLDKLYRNPLLKKHNRHE